MKLVSQYLPLQSTYDLNLSVESPPQGTSAYYLQCIGGARGLAQLYLEAGLLHLEGAASTLLSSSYSSLSSIRMPHQSQVGENGSEAWKRDREAAVKYFERVRVLEPTLEIPAIPVVNPQFEDAQELEMPSIELSSSAPGSSLSQYTDPDTPVVRRRRKKEEMSLFSSHVAEDDADNTWYLYIPGLVGAGTALLVVGIVGALSFSTWSRRNQGS